MDWSTYYPAYVLDTSAEQLDPKDPAKLETGGAVRKLRQDVEVADIGCGFGGLTVALAPLIPNTLILGW